MKTRLLRVMFCLGLLLGLFSTAAYAQVLSDSSEWNNISFIPISTKASIMGVPDLPNFIVSEDGQYVLETDASQKGTTGNAYPTKRIYELTNMTSYYDSAGENSVTDSSMKIMETSLAKNFQSSFSFSSRNFYDKNGDWIKNEVTIRKYNILDAGTGGVYYLGLSGNALQMGTTYFGWTVENDTTDSSKYYIYAKTDDKTFYLCFYEKDGNVVFGVSETKHAVRLYADYSHQYDSLEKKYTPWTVISFQEGENPNDTSTLTHYVVKNDVDKTTQFTFPAGQKGNVYKWRNSQTQVECGDEFKDYTKAPDYDDEYFKNEYDKWFQENKVAKDYYEQILSEEEKLQQKTDLIFGKRDKIFTPGETYNYEDYGCGEVFFPTYRNNCSLSYSTSGVDVDLDVRIGGSSSCYGQKINSGDSVWSGNWVVITIPTAKNSGYNYTIEDISIGNNPEYKQGKLSNGAEYIYFKMPEKDTAVNIKLSRVEDSMEKAPTLGGYVVEDQTKNDTKRYAYYGDNTDLTARAGSKIGLYVDKVGSVWDVGRQVVILPFDEDPVIIAETPEYWDEYLAYQTSLVGYESDAHQDKNTYTLVSCEWYQSVGGESDYKKLDVDVDYVSDAPGKEYDGTWITLPASDEDTTVYYQCRYTYKREFTGTTITRTITRKVNVKGLHAVKIYGYGYTKTPTATDICSMEMNSLYVKSDYTTKWEYSTGDDNWIEIPLNENNLITTSVYLDTVTTDPEPSTAGGITISSVPILRIQQGMNGYYKFTVTNPGTYTFRMTNTDGLVNETTLDFSGLHTHSWSDWIYTKDYHYKKCTVENCKAVQKGQTHTLDDDGHCTVCYTPTPATKYAITVKDSENGSVTADCKTAASGTIVTLNVKPDKSWTLETLTVTDQNGDEIDLNVVEIGAEYSFKMPSVKVTVTATFTEDNTMLKIVFKDVPSDAYYAEAVDWAIEKNITAGRDSTHFVPDGTCTRAEAVRFLWNAYGQPKPTLTTMNFKDVPKDSYYYDAVLWAVEKGITAGTGKDTFSPDENCTRAQIVAMLWRAEKSPEAGTDNPFNDVNKGAYYYDAVLWAANTDVTAGTSKTTFSPNQNCTRAQIVTFLWRALGK